MCGIAGFVTKENITNGKQILSNMAEAQIHRGPDFTGYFSNDKTFLSHNRLKIVDLRDVSNQPFISDDGRFVMCYNGEVYNYLKLREDLQVKGHEFFTESDTEVVLKSYIEYGNNAFTMFDGMFSIVIYDNNNDTLLFVRDKIGIKPLYYYKDENNMIFSSEIKSILKHPSYVKNINIQAIKNYFLLDHPVDNSTWFDNIFQFEPGNIYEYKNDLLKNQYFKIEFNEKVEKLDLKKFRNDIYNSIEQCVLADVPVGAHLSGGVDSGTIVSYIKKVRKINLKVFSTIFEKFKDSEKDQIEVLSNDVKIKPNYSTFNGHDVTNNINKIIYHLEEPVIGPAIVPMFFVSKLISENDIKVVNGGQGVDELFAGYPPFKIIRLQSILKNREIFEFLNIFYYLPFGKLLSRFNVFKKTKNCFLDESLSNTKKSLLTKLDKETIGMSKFQSKTYYMLKYFLPGLLHQEDRMSMAFSVESRVPFISNDLIKWSLTIPEKFKIKKGFTKWCFRQAVSDIVNTKTLFNKKKKGYSTPLSFWINDIITPYIKLNLKKSKIINDLIKVDIFIIELSKNEINENTLWKIYMILKWEEVYFCE